MRADRNRYSEMAFVLYTRPNFHFNHTRDMTSIQQMVSPTRFQTIRRISLGVFTQSTSDVRKHGGPAPGFTVFKPPEEEWKVLMSIRDLEELRLIPGLAKRGPSTDPSRYEKNDEFDEKNKIPVEMLRMGRRLRVFEIVVRDEELVPWREGLGAEGNLEVKLVVAPPKSGISEILR